MSGRHQKPTTSAISVAKIAFTDAVIGGSAASPWPVKGAATDGEWDPGRQLQIRRQLGHQHQR
jgi:hypothetical protein